MTPGVSSFFTSSMWPWGMASTSTPSTSTSRRWLRPNTVPATETSASLVFRRSAIRFANAIGDDDVDSTTWIPRSFATAQRVHDGQALRARAASGSPATAAGRSGFTSISRNSP